jgi:beta-phosphoglucomutase
LKLLEAFIFDLDGVLTDTAEYHFQAWKRMADEEGISFTRQDNEQLRGVSRRASLELILKGLKLPEEKILELMERKNSYYRDSITQITKKDLLPGSIELLKELKAKDYKLALASASKNAPLVVEKLGIACYFDLLADGHSVTKSKPAPDLFLYAAQKLNSPPSMCIVIEDAEAGIKAAKAAGMWTIGIGPKARVGAADFTYNSVADIDVDDICLGIFRIIQLKSIK